MGFIDQKCMFEVLSGMPFLNVFLSRVEKMMIWMSSPARMPNLCMLLYAKVEGAEEPLMDFTQKDGVHLMARTLNLAMSIERIRHNSRR